MNFIISFSELLTNSEPDDFIFAACCADFVPGLPRTLVCCSRRQEEGGRGVRALCGLEEPMGLLVQVGLGHDLAEDAR